MIEVREEDDRRLVLPVLVAIALLLVGVVAQDEHAVALLRRALGLDP